MKFDITEHSPYDPTLAPDFGMVQLVITTEPVTFKGASGVNKYNVYRWGVRRRITDALKEQGYWGITFTRESPTVGIYHVTASRMFRRKRWDDIYR